MLNEFLIECLQGQFLIECLRGQFTTFDHIAASFYSLTPREAVLNSGISPMILLT